jgi:hypothetical protein
MKILISVFLALMLAAAGAGVAATVLAPRCHCCKCGNCTCDPCNCCECDPCACAAKK